MVDDLADYPSDRLSASLLECVRQGLPSKLLCAAEQQPIACDLVAFVRVGGLGRLDAEAALTSFGRAFAERTFLVDELDGLHRIAKRIERALVDGLRAGLPALSDATASQIVGTIMCALWERLGELVSRAEAWADA